MNRKEVIIKRRNVLSIVTTVLVIVSLLSLLGLAGTVDCGRETPLVWVMIFINLGFLVLGGLGTLLLSSTNG